MSVNNEVFSEKKITKKRRYVQFRGDSSLKKLFVKEKNTRFVTTYHVWFREGDGIEGV